MVDETYVKVKGKWMYLYRAVDKAGASIDFYLSAHRDQLAAARFFKKALTAKHTIRSPELTHGSHFYVAFAYTI